MDVYQGKMKTISPAFGPYEINVFFDIDKITPDSGGITGMGHIVPIKWDIGITGLQQYVPT